MVELQRILDQFINSVGNNLLQLLAAFGVLILGWLIALVISAGIRAALKRIGVNDKFMKLGVEDRKEKAFDLEKWIAKGIYYLLMILVLVAFFQLLGLTIITEPLNKLLNKVLQYVPSLAGGAVLLVLAWITANILKFLVTKALTAVNVDKRLGDQAGIDMKDHKGLTQTVGEVTYWLVFLLFLPAVLETLALQGLLDPVRGMTDQLLNFLPNIFATVLIVVVGWFVARIIQRIVTGFLAAVGSDRLSEQVGLTSVLGTQKLSGLIGLIVYILILIPVLIAGLNALKLTVITTPATNMLDQFLFAIPRIFAASILLIIAYVVGKIVTGLIKNLLASIGLNEFLTRLGFSKDLVEGETKASDVVGSLLLVAIMFFATIEALRLLNYDVLAGLISNFLVLAGHVILGLVIFIVGLYLSGLASKTVQASGTAYANVLSLISRVAILVLAGAMALRQMGLANEIINMAFGILFGGIAVATALAFGLGGREIAGRQVGRWLDKVLPEKTDKEK
ncbi:MAG: mechanosensitive ion channel [bacterium]